MAQNTELQGLSLPTLEQEQQRRARMPWEEDILYSVETEDGDLIRLNQEQLERYAASRAARRSTGN